MLEWTTQMHWYSANSGVRNGNDVGSGTCHRQTACRLQRTSSCGRYLEPSPASPGLAFFARRAPAPWTAWGSGGRSG
jgi:hypothetical protein